MRATDSKGKKQDRPLTGVRVLGEVLSLAGQEALRPWCQGPCDTRGQRLVCSSVDRVLM